MFLFRALKSFKNVNPVQSFLLKADGLKQYGYFNEALKEAEKARDFKGASAFDKELAKGKIIEILNEIKQGSKNQPSH